jgi:DNA-binding FadR family transcriptional regulator
MRQSAMANGYFLDKDLAFHCAIYRTIGNRVLDKLLDVFCDIYRNLRDRSLLILREPVIEIENHERILRAIESQDTCCQAVSPSISLVSKIESNLPK